MGYTGGNDSVPASPRQSNNGSKLIEATRCGYSSVQFWARTVEAQGTVRQVATSQVRSRPAGGLEELEQQRFKRVIHKTEVLVLYEFKVLRAASTTTNKSTISTRAHQSIVQTPLSQLPACSTGEHDPL